MHREMTGQREEQRLDPEYTGIKAVLAAWEYWPSWLFNIPVVSMWLWKGLMVGDLKFFSRANPSIHTGGLFGDEKDKIYDLIPDTYVPATVCISKGITFAEAVGHVHAKKLGYPMVVKPNVGERGAGVRWIEEPTQWKAYHERASYDYLVQEAIHYPLEVSILVYRLPDQDRVEITSVCIKEKLIIIGDGDSTLEELIHAHRRSRRQWARLSQKWDGSYIPEKDEILLLEPIGNHIRGTRFLDGRHLVDEDLRRAMEKLLLSMKGEVYYGRFDMLCQSVEGLKRLEDFAIIEFNGVKSEPAHIYDPNYKLTKAYQDIHEHVNIMGRIARQTEGGRISWRDLWDSWWDYRRHRTVLNRLQG